MRSILVLNPKGGTGKTTMAANIATRFALDGKSVALVDCDPQQSALDWLAMRPEDRPVINGVDATQPGARMPRGTEIAIIDSPAACHGGELADLLRRAQTCVIPIVPSPIDINAAQRFLDELVEVGRVLNRKVRVATVANRVRENSPGRFELEEYLDSLKLPNGRNLPFVAVLRNSQNYVNASARGLGIFEMAPSRVERDLELWEPLIAWLRSKRSVPT